MSLKNVEDFYPLSPMQEGMLFHSLYAPGSGVYVLQFCCEIEGKLDLGKFEQAWARVVARHPVLRTYFVGGGVKKPVQVVERRASVPLRILDWRGLPDEARRRELEDFLASDRAEGFDLSRAPLMRLTLASLPGGSHQLVWSFHHILLDGWCLSPLLGEVFECYETLRAGREPRASRRRPYRDYIAWLRRQGAGEAERFWRESLKGFRSPTPLGVDRLAVEHGAESGYGRLKGQLSREVTEALQAFARREGLTLNVLAQGAWALLLSRYSGESDVVFGATVSGRPPALDGVEEMIGLFINTLPVRAEVEPAAPLADWLKLLQGRQAEARQYEHSPLVEVQGWSEVQRGRPLFESLLVFENYPASDSPGGRGDDGAAGLRIRQVQFEEQTNYPLSVMVAPGPQLSFLFMYDAARFDEPTVERMAGHYARLLEAIAESPGRALSELPMLSGAELRQLTHEHNETRSEYPDKCFHELFEEHAARTPDSTAVTFQGESLSYRELNESADRLARRLLSSGLAPESRVGLMLERTPRLLVATLGVMKAGGAYVPLDPSYPRERLAFMAEDAGLSVLITEQSLAGALPDCGAQLVLLDGEQEEAASIAPRRVSVMPWQVAYTIYTSGSTGRPKGVQVPHRALTNFLETMRDEPGMGDSDVLVAVTSLSFDIAALELYLPLTLGARLVLASRDEASDARLLSRLLSDSGATVMQATPSTWSMLLDSGWRAQGLKALCGGEALPKELASRLVESGARLWNMYGPTETTIWSSAEEVSASDIITIGRPIANTRLYVVDERMRPAPVGVSGELLIGGDGLARGYLKRPALTAEKFIPDPFSGEAGARLYRTGDVARRLADGRVECMGRNDEQVKIRGHRIELGEVEAALESHPQVGRAVAAAKEGAGGGRRLVAYVVCAAGAEAPGAAELRGHVRARLPEYMAPSAFVVLDALPLTPNGKVDRKALPEPEVSGPAGESYVAPRNSVEAGLAGIWEEVLNVRPVGVRDNFFELGGHSLMALRVVAKIHGEFGQELPLGTLFEEPTVERMARLLIRRVGYRALSPLVRLQPEGSRPPLFCIHPVGGTAFCYMDMARHLGEEQPLYGLQAVEEAGAEPSIEETAALYIEAVREAQAEGPYMLAGWSFGGLVAFEMAQQLRRAGEEVSLLAVIDAVAPVEAGKRAALLEAAAEGGEQLTPERLEADGEDPALLARLAVEMAGIGGLELSISFEHLRSLDTREAQLEYVLEEAKRAEVLPREVGMSRALSLVRSYRGRMRAAWRYEPRPYDGRVTLFRAAEPEAGLGPVSATMGWEELCSEPVETYDVPGPHARMVFEPHVSALAGALRGCLDGAQDCAQVAV
jgi:amino acid adenylation domain-containing protein